TSVTRRAPTSTFRSGSRDPWAHSTTPMPGCWVLNESTSAALPALRLPAKKPRHCGRGFQLTAARRSSVNLDLAGRARAEAVVEEELALLSERVLERLARLELRVEKSFEELSRAVHVDVARIVEERHRGPDRDAQMRRRHAVDRSG